MIQRVLILGTGLIGSSVGLALRDAGFPGEIAGWDPSSDSLAQARQIGAINTRLAADPAAHPPHPAPDLILLAGPVLSILDWMNRLAPICGPNTLLTDVGSTKLAITQAATRLFNQPGHARFIPGHPMAGKESGGAALAEPTLFRDAAWLFTPAEPRAAQPLDPTDLAPSPQRIVILSAAEDLLSSSEPPTPTHPVEAEWRGWVTRFGSRTLDLDAARHDEICAWVSHLPQMLSTALAALLEDTFASDPEARDQIAAIGGRALRETTRLGASPYSMWRDVALTNTDPIAHTLHALEQRLAHLRENLRTPELREEFRIANHFRKPRD
ncbi:MAG: prephenate/arogenate dehydrogenase family protein [Acidobacteriaceae bacterium]